MADSNNSSSNQRYRKYHPQQDHLPVPIQSLYDLPTSPEYLFFEEAAQQRRSWGENLQFYTGCSYLTGAVVGGAKGTAEALMAAERGESMYLRANGVLNCGGQTGRKYGNTLGILGLMFAGLESGIVHYRDGNDDILSTALAGLGTGAIYKAASGPRSAVVAGAIGGLAAAAVVAGKQVVFPAIKRYVPSIPI